MEKETLKKFTSFIREMAEEGEKKLKHLEHAEDHIINAGKEGVDHAMSNFGYHTILTLFWLVISYYSGYYEVFRYSKEIEIFGNVRKTHGERNRPNRGSFR